MSPKLANPRPATPADENAQAEDAGAEDPQAGETGEEGQDAGNAGEEAETEELKVVLHVRNGRANAGVWRPGADGPPGGLP